MNNKLIEPKENMVNSKTPKNLQSSINDELSGLLALCKMGDKHAFSLLYKTTSGRLNGIAYRITRDVDSANEVLQEAFIQVWQNIEQYQAHKSEPFTWLASIVRYRAYDRLRYDKRRHQKDMIEFDELDVMEEHFQDIFKSSQALSIENYSEQALNHCLSKLEQKQSQSILMAYLYGYSREDISNYFDTPVNTIKSWIRRGLGRLKLCLSN